MERTLQPSEAASKQPKLEVGRPKDLAIDGARGLARCEILPSQPKDMRTVAQIPHRAMRIVVQEWNEKYHVQFVWGPLEQTYRLPVEGSGGLEAVRGFASRLIPEVEQAFLTMKAARAAALTPDSPEA
jgi:hypothetical protein